MKRLLISFLLLFFLGVQSNSTSLASNNQIKLVIKKSETFKFPESTKFLHTLTQKQINFKENFFTYCTNTDDAYTKALIFYPDGRRESYTLKGVAKVKTFKWLKDSNEQYVLNVIISCSQSAKIPVVSANYYKICYGFERYSYGNFCTLYTPADLKNARWNVTYELPLDLKDGPGIWRPIVNSPTN